MLSKSRLAMLRLCRLGLLFTMKAGPQGNTRRRMADPLHLNLWFPSFEEDDMLPRALAVMKQFPFSAQPPGITYLALQPVSWNEASVLEERFRPGITPEEAIQ